MTGRKKVLKFFIIIILAIFLLSTGLISVLYLGWSKGTSWTGDVLSWDIVLQTWNTTTWIVDTKPVDTKTVDTWTVTTKIVDVWTVSPLIVGTWTQ